MHIASKGHSNHSRTHRHLLVAFVLSAALALILRAHGVTLWYAPAAVVAAHALVLAALAGVVAWITRGKHHADAAHPHGMLIHAPRFYDTLARFLLLGRESSFRRRILDLADLQPGAAILDVGCGTGTLLIAAAERVGPAGALHGVEPAPEMAAHARKKAAAAGAALHIAEGSADRLPYPDASFDAVFCTLALHHVPVEKHVEALREMHRVLRLGGRLVIVEIRRPRSLRAAFTVFSLLHGLASHAPVADPEALEPVVRELGFDSIALPTLGASLGALTALRAA